MSLFSGIKYINMSFEYRGPEKGIGRTAAHNAIGLLNQRRIGDALYKIRFGLRFSDDGHGDETAFKGAMIDRLKQRGFDFIQEHKATKIFTMAFEYRGPEKEIAATAARIGFTVINTRQIDEGVFEVQVEFNYREARHSEDEFKHSMIACLKHRGFDLIQENRPIKNIIMTFEYRGPEKEIAATALHNGLTIIEQHRLDDGVFDVELEFRYQKDPTRYGDSEESFKDGMIARLKHYGFRFVRENPLIKTITMLFEFRGSVDELFDVCTHGIPFEDYRQLDDGLLEVKFEFRFYEQPNDEEKFKRETIAQLESDGFRLINSY